MHDDRATIHIDGGSRGNPGPASFAFVIETDSGVLEHAEPLGKTTNNVAEYTALVRVLKKSSELGLKHLEIMSDSELLVKQMNGVYKVKSPELLPLFEEAKREVQAFKKVILKHVRREFNKDADALCNEVLDSGNSVTRDSRLESDPVATAISPEEYLEMMAQEWIRVGRLQPPVADVLAKLRTLLH
jgi:ribonuclease HI